jgi:hypothetical protein
MKFKKLLKKFQKKIENDILKDQDENYLIRTIDSIYHRTKNILHLHSDNVYCLS